MTRKLRRNYSLSVVTPFIVILILLIAAGVLAQTSGAGQRTGKASVLLAPAGPSAPAQAELPLSPWTGAGSSAMSRTQTKRHGTHPMDGNPLGFFLAGTYPSGGHQPWRLAVGDVNGDGKPDIVIANDCWEQGACYMEGSVTVLLSNGDGTFQPAAPYWSGGGEAMAVAIADVNGDGKPDLLVANYYAPGDGAVGVLLGNGDGTFQPAVAYDSGTPGAWTVTVADVNGDGKPDLVVGSFDSFESAVSILLGNGDGTFQGAQLCCYNVTGLSAAAADLNGDGILDLVSAVPCSSGCNGEGSVAVQLGEGNGTFQWTVQYDSGGRRPLSVAVADVNGDGKPDIVVANNWSNTVGVLLGNGDGTFQPVVTYGSGGNAPSSVVLADMNGDGKLDIVVANRSPSGGGSGGLVGVLLGNGSTKDV